MRWLTEKLLLILMAVGAVLHLSGCESDKAQAVGPQDFYARHTAAVAPISPLDRAGVIPLPDARSQPPAQPPGQSTGSNDSNGDAAASDLHANAIPTTEPTTLPASVFNEVTAEPATMPVAMPVMATDQYMVLGGVAQVVNGTPIYANKILRLDIDVLRTYAQQMDFEHYKIAAEYQIEKTLSELAQDEMEVAAAERTLDPKDIQMAHALTTLWRQNQIAEAGGSEQVAQLRAHASGEDFEDQEQDVYRSFLQKLYIVRKIEPEIDVTVDDEMRYYRAHKADFTSPTQCTILLIEADPAKNGVDSAAAKAKLADIRQRTLGGEDFADYARRQNDLPGATGESGSGGQVVVKPNSLVFSNVEAQVWKTTPGHISDVIEDQGAFFLFKVITQDVGGTKPFADRKVQETITKQLTIIQRMQHRDAEIIKLESQAIKSEPNIETVLEMAKQNYPAWSKK